MGYLSVVFIGLNTSYTEKMMPVIQIASAFPADLKESANIFRVKGWLWWKNIILPGISPHIVTGVITAYGGAWNTSIIAGILGKCASFCDWSWFVYYKCRKC
ncbi:MAG TPA: ABC transporter permease subunit [Rickettsia endosymbiont of Columbicola hoogstraali]|nr:ABC transporter permease subunit [Rickettsia endosymbiont of Columbicola hoogstraali]